jgi:hypothetical protein
MNAWLITVLTGVIIAAIGLVLEYRYFKPRREVVNSAAARWSTAIDNAVQTLSKSYPEGSLRFTKSLARNGLFRKTAQLRVEVTERGTTKNLYVKIDQSGDILEVESWVLKSF